MNDEQESKEKSEKRNVKSESDLDREITAGEWTRLIRFKIYRQRSRQGRVLAVYQALSNRLDQLVKAFYELARQNQSLAAAGKLMKEINYLRRVRDSLLVCLTWNETDVLPELPEEVEEIIG
ncbi:hypothetical protein COW80_03770 [Candidatus Beckwithbacteria bacterium CG22_combo_CG10-13_8_21_14_all_01_47_9]|uniref:Uncharacterized protein n=5 Tax=Candidatus Beckwithiibacteriota TaxID=1752726 RepID=A0A2H0E1W6_9BACT|nr:MAG: hypothetical protein AUJ59_04715 [Candidatus Beckwithbacteria bacterium CG1_02_47_37]OIP79296.1 MAG: hypothetical protein AUK17_00545 [Parcubacteria group bacterium CG2_30_44_18]PIP51877.1 MAG: hypothetical protein COX09_04745 [Candidatus Beckwithbacteria bacterium CG23_combo_of_CG06-09_8_20_14_all_47_9]PIP87810.1 MAG: hypothetical protein COW80_03770 [Candidatus Beckwithbacteria bacterium CG22_combo_CG10-13_8_21_14_all_01_47_9]PJA22643.1 MAG: hypothetical protein COX59_02455 [Candidatu